MKNYYEILEVSPNASPEVIEKAYKALVKKYHPDLQPTDKKAEFEEKIKIINEAYDILSDMDKRNKYNKQLESENLHKKQVEYEKKDYDFHTQKQNVNNSKSTNTSNYRDYAYSNNFHNRSYIRV